MTLPKFVTSAANATEQTRLLSSKSDNDDRHGCDKGVESRSTPSWRNLPVKAKIASLVVVVGVVVFGGVTILGQRVALSLNSKSSITKNIHDNGVQTQIETPYQQVKTVDMWKLGQDASRAYKVTANSTGTAWRGMQNNSARAWNSVENKTEQIWDSDVKTLPEETQHWWNQAMHREQEWSNKTGREFHHLSESTEHDMHKLSKRLQSWWNNTETSTEHKEHVLHNEFQHWWHHASHEERQWWNDTVVSYHHFSQEAQHDEHLWWHIMQNDTHRVGDWTKEEEKTWWNATRHWFHMQADYEEQLRQPPLYMNSSRAYAILMSDYGWYDASADYFLLQSGWDVQINQAYCGLASASTILNSLSSIVSIPTDSNFEPYKYATQVSVKNHPCVIDTVSFSNDTVDGIYFPPGGLTLDQVGDVIKCFVPPTFDVQVRHVSPLDVTIESMRRELQQAIRDPRSRVIINYSRDKFGQKGTGHFSPLAAYSKAEDSFLILDVAKYKYPPAWVTTARLWQSMATLDSCGEWDYPGAQRSINASLLERVKKGKDWDEARKILKCEPAYRGYIIVESL